MAFDDEAGDWEQERPEPLPAEHLPALLAEAPPQHDLAAFLHAFGQPYASCFAEEDPAAEMARRVNVARHRGRHVIHDMRTGVILETLTYDADALQGVIAAAREGLDLDQPVDADLLARLEALLPLFRAVEAGVIDEGLPQLLVPLLVPLRPDLRGWDPNADPDTAAQIPALIEALPDLSDRCPDLMSRIAVDVARMIASEVP